jgi:dynein heavy chain
LRELISTGAAEPEKLEKLEEISGKASGEAGIESQMKEIQSKWLELNFEVKQYRTKD